MIRFKKKMNAIPVRLIHHGQSVMGGMTFQGEHPPGGWLLHCRRSAAGEKNDQAGKQSSPFHHQAPPAAILKENHRDGMALTPSTMLDLGTPLPLFDLPDVSGGNLTSESLDSRPVLLMVICAHCPFVKHIEPELTRIEHDYGQRVQMVGVSSNSLITHPQDGAEQLAEQLAA